MSFVNRISTFLVSTDFFPLGVTKMSSDVPLLELTKGVELVSEQNAQFLQEGYKQTAYFDEEVNEKIPVLMINVNADNIIDVFLDLISELGEVVDVFLNRSDEKDKGNNIKLFRGCIEQVILRSYIEEHKDLLLNDGFVGIAVQESGSDGKFSQEIFLDEHKVLIIYSYNLEKFEKILKSHGTYKNDDMEFIYDLDHIHDGDESSDEFIELATQLCAEEDPSDDRSSESDFDYSY